MTHASLCTGIGGFDFAAACLGWTNMFQCEIDQFCRQVLNYHFPKTIRYENIIETDFSQWCGQIDVLSAGFPCQPFSVAGERNGAGDNRYLWPEIVRAIGQIRPSWFVGENVAGLTSMVFPGCEVEVASRAGLFGESYQEVEERQRFILHGICEDLESIGYSVETVVIPACAVGAPHRRDRIWIIAHSERRRRGEIHKEIQSGKPNGEVAHTFGDEWAVANADGHDAGRYGHSEVEQTEGAGKENQQQRKWVRGDVERACNETTASDTGELYGRDLCGQKSQKSKIKVDCNDSIRSGWEDFPTQPPVCCRNDGVFGKLAGITFSKWREQSIKALGNAVVPQIPYQIFSIIEKLYS